MLIRFFLTQRLQVTFSPKPSLSLLYHEHTGHTLNTCERLMTPHKSQSKRFCCLSSPLFILKCHWFDFHLHLFYPVGWPLVLLVSNIIFFLH